jgi:hypothetical protein
VEICVYFSSYKGLASRKVRETLLSSNVTQLLLSNIGVFIVCFMSLPIYDTIVSVDKKPCITSCVLQRESIATVMTG